MYFPPFEPEGKQFGEHEPTGEIAYVSAFPTSCQIIRHCKVGHRSQRSKRRLILVKRSIETIILIFSGVSLLLESTLMAMASELLIRLKDHI
jgi:hypothetical protein